MSAQFDAVSLLSGPRCTWGPVAPVGCAQSADRCLSRFGCMEIEKINHAAKLQHSLKVHVGMSREEHGMVHVL
jgi:hypothetical protein